jgi:hypothetical protein
MGLDESLADTCLELLNTTEHKIMGYRDVLWIEGGRGLACLLGDMNPISRVDSYFTNMRMPWESKDAKEPIYSVGLFKTMISRNDSSTMPSFTTSSSFSYGYQCICVTYCEPLGVFAVGLDNGYVHCYHGDARSLNSIKETFSIKAHSKRVMSVAIDGEKEILLSVGEDGFLQVCDMLRRQIVASSLISELREQVETVRAVLRLQFKEVADH